MRSLSFAAIAALCTAVTLHATPLIQVTSGTGVTSGNSFQAQSFTMPGTGSDSNITFNFFTPSLQPYALGTGYLLDELYSGPPDGLNSSLPGYLGSGTASNGVYTFSPSVTLQAGQLYYFYEDADLPSGATTGGATYGGGVSYGTASATSSIGYLYGFYSDNFAVNGTPASITPEPSSIALLGTGLFGVAGVLRRRALTK